MPKKGFIFSIDPSSTCTGWASIKYDFSGSKTIWRQDFIHVEVSGTVKMKGGSKRPMIDRVQAMVDGLNATLGCHLYGEAETDPLGYDIVIETPSGKVGMRHGGGGAGLSVYGFACGYIYHAMTIVREVTERDMKRDYLYDALPNVTVHSVSSNWMAGQSKLKRQRVAERYRTAYDPNLDKGNDESDAIALAVWWAQKRWKLIRAG